jgi:hypothetical protein
VLISVVTNSHTGQKLVAGGAGGTGNGVAGGNGIVYLEEGNATPIVTTGKKITLSGTYKNIFLFGSPELEINTNTVIDNLTLPDSTRVIHNSGSLAINDTLSLGSGTIAWDVHKTVTSIPTVQNLNIPSGTTLTTSAHTGTYNYLLAIKALGNLTVQSG